MNRSNLNRETLFHGSKFRKKLTILKCSVILIWVLFISVCLRRVEAGTDYDGGLCRSDFTVLHVKGESRCVKVFHKQKVKCSKLGDMCYSSASLRPVAIWSKEMDDALWRILKAVSAEKFFIGLKFDNNKQQLYWAGQSNDTRVSYVNPKLDTKFNKRAKCFAKDALTGNWEPVFHEASALHYICEHTPYVTAKRPVLNVSYHMQPNILILGREVEAECEACLGENGAILWMVSDHGNTKVFGPKDPCVTTEYSPDLPRKWTVHRKIRQCAVWERSVLKLEVTQGLQNGTIACFSYMPSIFMPCEEVNFCVQSRILSVQYGPRKPRFWTFWLDRIRRPPDLRALLTVKCGACVGVSYKVFWALVRDGQTEPIDKKHPEVFDISEDPKVSTHCGPAVNTSLVLKVSNRSLGSGLVCYVGKVSNANNLDSAPRVTFNITTDALSSMASQPQNFDASREQYLLRGNGPSSIVLTIIPLVAVVIVCPILVYVCNGSPPPPPPSPSPTHLSVRRGSDGDHASDGQNDIESIRSLDERAHRSDVSNLHSPLGSSAVVSADNTAIHPSLATPPQTASSIRSQNSEYSWSSSAHIF